MPFHQVDEIRYYSFDLLAGEPGVLQGVFSRRGGVSPAPWDSLNLGGTVGDPRENVLENRRRMAAAIGRSADSLFDVWQVHGVEVICTDRPRPAGTIQYKADVIVTDRPEVTLFMRFADCVPVLLYDPIRRVAAAAHAGWQGTVQRVAAVAVQAMVERYGSQPADILAGIGPSICPEHYVVGQDVVERAQAAFGADAAGLLPTPNGDVHFDLWAANTLVLQQAGVKHIQVAGVCTACHLEDWYSHRGEKGRTGRFGALLALK